VRGYFDRMLARWFLTVLLASLPVSAVAATFTVDSTADAVDANPGDGHCATAAGQCTLRAAVQEANATPGADTIMLPAGTYKLKLPGIDEDEAASGDLDLTGDVTIVGAGSKTTFISAKKLKDRVFHVFGTATVSGVTVRRGTAPAKEDGGGFLVVGSLSLSDVVVRGCSTPADGAGIFATGASVTIRDSMLVGNHAGHNSGGMEIDSGSADLTRVVITKNGALNESGGLEVSASTATLTDCTIRGNHGVSDAGGVENEDGGRLTLTGCQVVGNHAKMGGGIATEDDPNFGPATTTISNTTVVKNATGNCLGAVVSLGGNHDSDGSCKF